MFKAKKIEGKTVYYSTKIEVEHFFTTRELIVKDNIDLIKDYLKVKRLLHPHQVHSDNIEFVLEDKDEYPNCDGLILNDKNTGIYLNFADCTPVVLYDKRKNLASIVHAGWRGTAACISKKAVKLMGSNPKDIVALIGPCISFLEFETSNEALALLKKTLNNPEGLFQERYADLKGINKRQLEEIGVEDIDVCPYCTVLDNDKFFSYRKENKTKLRHSAVICLGNKKL